MNKKQKEDLVIALLEKGATYREITKQANVSPNTIKAIANRAGLDGTTSISSRTFELYSHQKFPSPLEAAIKLGLKAEVAILYHQEYFMLLGLTEFTKVYPQIKDNPWLYVNLARLVQNARMGDSEVLALLKIANGYLPRVRLECDRLKEEIRSVKAELNNTVRTYQDFCDRNIKLSKREHELQLSISELEVKKIELQNVITELQDQASMLRERNMNRNILDLEVKQMEMAISMNDGLIPSHDVTNNYQQNENEVIHCPQVEPSLPRALIFDTKGLT